MRKLSLQQYAVSLDGYILEEGTDFYRWWEALPDDDEMEEYFVATLRRAGTHIMGRVTYQGMAGHWPMSPEPVAPVMNDIPKVVFSRTLPSADWPESRIARGDTAEEIARLKAEPGRDIVAHGGVRFVQPLARLGVVDEYRLYVYPIAIGSGKSLFALLVRVFDRRRWRDDSDDGRETRFVADLDHGETSAQARRAPGRWSGFAGLDAA